MDGLSSPPPSNSSPTTTTSKSLCNLPSRGLFSSTSLFSNQGGMRVYVCDHDTAPPEDQLIKTNQTNILIRSLKKEKNESSLKDVKDTSARKRGADKALDGRSKRAMTEGSSNDSSPSMNFHSLTVERLRALLKEKGLSLRGKKDELVARLRNG